MIKTGKIKTKIKNFSEKQTKKILKMINFIIIDPTI